MNVKIFIPLLLISYVFAANAASISATNSASMVVNNVNMTIVRPSLTSLIIGSAVISNSSITGSKLDINSQSTVPIYVSSSFVYVNNTPVVSEEGAAISEVMVNVFTNSGISSINIQKVQGGISITEPLLALSVPLNIPDTNILVSESRLYVDMPGKRIEINVMPSLALTISGATNSSVTSISLVKSIDNNSINYVIDEDKLVKILWLFPVKMNVVSTLDSGTGMIVRVDKPWWSIFAGAE
ncbi:Uncharacterised protein [Candidatus Tiddalikarchaeum anstoanum]|nr:Uncharacterised protein [Candidatus Tiddalikarchaeum anstoanum]